MNNFKTVSKNMPDDGNKEYLNAIIALNELEKVSDKKYKELMKTQITGFIGKMSMESEDISWLETINHFVALKMPSDVTQTDSESKKNSDQNSVQTYSSSLTMKSNGSNQPNSSQKSYVTDDSVNLMIARSIQKDFVKTKDPYLSKKNSWQDRLKETYKVNINSFIQSGEDKDELTVDVTDFRDLDFGDNHGTVHNTAKGPYRWDQHPKNAMIYFFNWMLKKMTPKIYFQVPRISEDCRIVKLEISKNTISRYGNTHSSKEPVGMVDNGSDNGSILSGESYANKVSSGVSGGLAEMI